LGRAWLVSPLRGDIARVPALRQADFVLGQFPIGTIPIIDMAPDIRAKSHKIMVGGVDKYHFGAPAPGERNAHK